MAREMADLFKPLHVQKVPFGVDPKTVLCLNFKAGHCERGRKCKFSHDLAVERKAQKRDLYSDNRENEEELKQKDDMVDWDEGTPVMLASSLLISPRKTPTGRHEQAWQPQNHDRQGVQILRRGSREWQVWLVLGLPKWRRQMHV